MKKIIISVAVCFIGFCSFGQNYPKVVKNSCAVKSRWAIKLSENGYLGHFNYGSTNDFPSVPYGSESLFSDSLSAVALLKDIKKENLKVNKEVKTDEYHSHVMAKNCHYQ